MIRNFFLILLLVSLSACAKTTFIRSAPNYSDSLVKSQVTLLLPPEVEVYQVDAMNKKTRVHNYEDQLEEIIIDEFLNAMHEKGYTIKALTRSEIGASKLSRVVVDTKEEFNNILKVLYAGGAWTEDKAYSINHIVPCAAEIGQKTGANLLVTINFYAESKTSAAISKDFAASILKGVLLSAATGRTNISAQSDTAEVSVVRVAILDALSGRVLWTNGVNISNDMIGSTINSFKDGNKVDKQKISTLFNSALKELPSI